MINIKRTAKGAGGEKTPVMLRVPLDLLERFRGQVNGPLAVGILELAKIGLDTHISCGKDVVIDVVAGRGKAK